MELFDETRAIRTMIMRIAHGRFLMLTLVVFAALSLVSPASAAPETRVALIFANAEYDHVRRLNNPQNDAQLIKATLTALHFNSITLIENANHDTMDAAIKAFRERAEQADVAVIYYAGHGIEVNHTNYLVPRDAKLMHDRDAEREAISLDKAVEAIEGAHRLRLVILDACRDNPLAASMIRTSGASRAITRGLAPYEPPGDSLVVYSAKAGHLADDGAQRNSPFARAVARRLIEEGSEISFVFRKVRDDVLSETSGDQEPATYGSLSSREFYFRPPTATAAGRAKVDLEAEAWALCKSAATVAPCNSYLARFANGTYSDLARLRMTDLSQPQVAVAAPVNQKAETAAIASPASSRGVRAMGGAKPLTLRVGPIFSARDCRLYMGMSGRSATYADPLTYASAASWSTWFVKDCTAHFERIRTAVEAALASSGRVVIGPGGYLLSGSLANVTSDNSNTYLAGHARRDQGTAIASDGVKVAFDVTIKDAAGRIVFGAPLTKRLETGSAIQGDNGAFGNSSSGEGIYAELQQSLALALARKVAFHFAPLRVLSTNGKTIRLDAGAPMLSPGLLINVTSAPGDASVRYRVTSASDGSAWAEQYGDGDTARITPGSTGTPLEDDDPAANQPRFDKVELP